MEASQNKTEIKKKTLKLELPNDSAIPLLDKYSKDMKIWLHIEVESQI